MDEQNVLLQLKLIILRIIKSFSGFCTVWILQVVNAIPPVLYHTNNIFHCSYAKITEQLLGDDINLHSKGSTMPYSLHY